jgi:hypothetical protein
MKNKTTGQELIECLKESCRDSGKLFIPDSPRQEAVADSLAEHYDSEIILETIKYFVKSRTGPFLMFDFAIESKKLTDKIKQEKESKEKFMRIVKDTQNRMASE